LTPDPIPPAALDFALEVEHLYAVLLRSAEPSASADDEPSLGGKLLYAGELTPSARALLIAGNIAGAASLSATADPTAQKQAVREGVADFLVNSLDEALRILKNEIRKREAVAVCIAIAPKAVEREMRERGVLPDLFPPAQFLSALTGQSLIAWTAASAPAQWLPRLDAIVLDCLDSEARAERRWLRLAPRYLGRMAQSFRILHCPRESAQEFVSRTKSAVDRGEISVEVQITVDGNPIVMRLPANPATDSLTR
jgi:urocanate hydratase